MAATKTAGGAEERRVASIVIQVPARIKRNGTEKDNDEFMDLLVEPLRDAGLIVEAFYSLPSNSRDKKPHSIFLVVSARLDRLLLEAERTKMTLLLDPGKLGASDVNVNTKLAALGLRFEEKTTDQEHVDLRIPNEVHGAGCRAARIDPYDDIWAPFNPDIYPLTLRQRSQAGSTSDPDLLIQRPNKDLYMVHPDTQCILTETQALRLLVSIISARRSADGGGSGDNGAGLNLDQLAHKKRIKRWFPAHNPRGMEVVKESWGKIPLPWRLQPEPIKDYFSERVAFYFAFLAHYAMWLIVPALVGIGIFADQVVRKTPGVSYLPVIGALVAVWSTFFMEAWKRRQSTFAARWGMTEYSQSEPLRPEFVQRASRSRSKVDGKPAFNTNPVWHKVVGTATGSVTLTMLGVVIVVVGCIFWLRVFLVQRSKDNGGPIPNGFPDYITSVINAIQIQVMNYLYTHMATWLTNKENHRTATAYDNSLIIKLAIFQCLNSYFGLIYIAAIKNNITIQGERQYCKLNGDGEPDCMSELQSQLAILMLTRLVMGNFLEYGLPILLRWLGRLASCCVRRDPDAQAAAERLANAQSASPYEKEAGMPTYDTFNDYLNIMLQFGFVTLFVVAFPLAPLIALVDAIINSFTDRSRMFTSSARPVPKGASGIGAWRIVFEGLSYASAVSNLTIVVFTNRNHIFGRDLDDNGRLIFFVVAEHVILLLKWGIAMFVPDTTGQTERLLQRQEYLVDKHVFGVKDMIVNADDTLTAGEDELDGSHDATGSGGGGGAGAAASSVSPSGRHVVRPTSASAAAARRRALGGDGATGDLPIAESWFAYQHVPNPMGNAGSGLTAGATATNVMIAPAAGSGAAAMPVDTSGVASGEEGGAVVTYPPPGAAYTTGSAV